jgi:arylsulfatase A-like enzyme
MTDPPNVLLLVVDSLRYDAVFGRDAFDTPALDGLAEDGLVFTNAFSHGISTAPAMTALLTGRHPLDYGGHWFLDESQPTFAETFSAAGYRTGAFHSNPYVSSSRNFDKGFDTFEEDVVPFEPDGYLARTPDRLLRYVSRISRLLSRTPYTPVTEVNERLLDWIDGTDGPWFLWAQVMDVHGPYLPGDDYTYRSKLRAEWLWRKAAVHDPDGITEAEREELYRNYRAELEYVDRELGNLLDALGRRGDLEDTVVIVTGDHGDEFYEHGLYGHRNLPYDELVHVPLVIRFPPSSDAPAARVDHLARGVDVLPTVLDGIGVDLSETMSERMAGESLLPLVHSDAEPGFDHVVIEKKVWSGSELRFGFRTKRWKFIYDGVDGRVRLYDLAEDPGEQTNVVDARPDVAERFRDLLRARIQRIERTSADVTVPEIDAGPGVDERLRALGYK